MKENWNLSAASFFTQVHHKVSRRSCEVAWSTLTQNTHTYAHMESEFWTPLWMRYLHLRWYYLSSHGSSWPQIGRWKLIAYIVCVQYEGGAVYRELVRWIQECDTWSLITIIPIWKSSLSCQNPPTVQNPPPPPLTYSYWTVKMDPETVWDPSMSSGGLLFWDQKRCSCRWRMV